MWERGLEMQSIVVHGGGHGHGSATATATALQLMMRNLLGECRSVHQQRWQKNGSLLAKLKQLLSESSSKTPRSMSSMSMSLPPNVGTVPAAAATTTTGTCKTSSSLSLNLMRLLLPYQQLFWSGLPLMVVRPFLSLDAAVQKALHLITAYSGYSKDYLNSTYNTNIKSTRIDLSSSSSNTTNNNNNNNNNQRLGLNKKKGCIGDDAWFISKQKHADFLGALSLEIVLIIIVFSLFGVIYK